MTYFIRLAVLTLALFGLIGQSTAMAMVSAGMTKTAATMSGMDCADMAMDGPSGKAPCKKMTLRCMAAMGCAALAMIEPSSRAAARLTLDRVSHALPATSRLIGRSFGPEPDPPTILI